MFVNSFAAEPAQIRIFHISTQEELELLYNELDKGIHFILDENGEKIPTYDIILDDDKISKLRTYKTYGTDFKERLISVGDYVAYNQKQRLFVANEWVYDHEWAKGDLPAALVLPVVIPKNGGYPSPNER